MGLLKKIAQAVNPEAESGEPPLSKKAEKTLLRWLCQPPFNKAKHDITDGFCNAFSGSNFEDFKEAIEALKGEMDISESVEQEILAWAKWVFEDWDKQEAMDRADEK